jgi:hypothetical protein
MVSRNNKRTRNKKNKSRNKRNTRKKSMNRYKRSLKKKRSKRNYKKRTINKKLQRGGVIELSLPFNVDGKQLTLEETFGEKERQFYNAVFNNLFSSNGGRVQIKGNDLKQTLEPYLNRMMDLQTDAQPLMTKIRQLSRLTEEPTQTDLRFHLHDLRLNKYNLTEVEERAQCVKLGLGRHSESESNWLIPSKLRKKTTNIGKSVKYEMYYGYVTPFLTPYGRALAYSTGYYEYGDHILMNEENLEFYSSTLPRSMITAMLMLRGIIQRLTETSSGVSEDDMERMIRKGGNRNIINDFVGERLTELISLYRGKTIRVVYGCSEIPEQLGGPEVFGATERAYTNTNTPFAGESGSYVQRIMKADMLEPLKRFINATECGDTGINLVLDESGDKPRPYLWREGDPPEYYHSDDETLDRFFNELSKIPNKKRLGDKPGGDAALPGAAAPVGEEISGGVRHMFIVHGILMEKYISWPFFAEYFRDMMNDGSDATPETSRQRPGSGDSGVASEPQSESVSEISISNADLKRHILIVMDKLISKLGHDKPLHQELSQVLFWGGFNLGTIKHMVEGMGLSDDSDLISKLQEIEMHYKSLIRRLQDGITLNVTDIHQINGLNDILKQIGDPRNMEHSWFQKFLADNISKINKLKEEGENPEETLFRKLMEGPLNKTPFNCSTVMATFIGPRIDSLGNNKDPEISKIRDDARNLYLSYCCYDVKFLAPSVRLRGCPPANAPADKTNYTELLEVLKNNMPDLTMQTDGLIMKLLNGTVTFQSEVRKQKPTMRKWEPRYLIIRGKGIYFHDITEGGYYNPIPRGSSCHDISRGTLTLFTEEYSFGKWAGVRDSIMITFPENGYMGTDNKEISGEMKFSFFNEGLRNECLGHLQSITEQPIGAGAVRAAGAVGVAGEDLEPEPDHEIVTLGEPGPQAADDNASSPIVARGYIYKKSRKLHWPQKYIVLKGKGIYIYESEKDFLKNNPDQGFSAERRDKFTEEGSHTSLKGFRESSTHDITSGELSPIGIESVGGTGGRLGLDRAKIEIKFNPSYTSADPGSTSNFLDTEITFAVLGYDDTVEEARENSGEELMRAGHHNKDSQLKTRGFTESGDFHENPPFYVLLYNKIWETLNTDEETKRYV